MNCIEYYDDCLDAVCDLADAVELMNHINNVDELSEFDFDGVMCFEFVDCRHYVKFSFGFGLSSEFRKGNESLNSMTMNLILNLHLIAFDD